MAKLKRYHEDGAVYFITTTTKSRKPIFNTETTCNLFLDILLEKKKTHNFDIYGFVIMPDHIHIIIQPSRIKDISHTMREIKGAYSRKYNKAKAQKEIIWQRSFYDYVIRNLRSARQSLEYIHNNPFEKGLKLALKYSSYGFYYEGDETYKELITPLE